MLSGPCPFRPAKTGVQPQLGDPSGAALPAPGKEPLLGGDTLVAPQVPLPQWPGRQAPLVPEAPTLKGSDPRELHAPVHGGPDRPGRRRGAPAGRGVGAPGARPRGWRRGAPASLGSG